MGTTRRIFLIFTFLFAGFAYSGSLKKSEDPNRVMGGALTKNHASCPFMNRDSRSSLLQHKHNRNTYSGGSPSKGINE